jgi:hypothetical protein
MRGGRAAGGALSVVGALGLVASQLVSAGPVLGAAATIGPGSALATATLISAGPAYGGLSITVSAGTTTAYLQAGDAQASAQILNAGSVSGLTGSAPAVGGLEAVTADSTRGKSTKTSGGPVVGTETVSVNPSPESASAAAQLLALDVPGVVHVDAQASSGVSYSSSGQTASSEEDVSVELAGGLVTLEGLRWETSQTLAAKRTTTSSFSVADVSLGGVALPVTSPGQLASVVGEANRLLATLGVQILLPETSTDPTSGAVTISGLDIRIGRSAITNALLAPLQGPVGQVEKNVNAALAAGGQALAQVVSTVGTAETLGALVLGILAGAGQVNLDLGGLVADSEPPPDFVNPLGATAPVAGGSIPSSAMPPTLPPAVGTSGATAGSISGGLPNTASTMSSALGSPLPTGVSAGGGGAVGSSQQAASARTPLRCTTTSPAGHPGCWGGIAQVVGAVLLISGVGMFIADAYTGRRRRFRVVKEVQP